MKNKVTLFFDSSSTPVDPNQKNFQKKSLTFDKSSMDLDLSIESDLEAFKSLFKHNVTGTEFEGTRNKSNVKSVHTLMFDFDEKEVNFKETVEKLEKSGFNYIVTPSMSFSQEHQKHHVFIPLLKPITKESVDFLKVSSLKKILIQAQERLRVSSRIDESTCDASRFYFATPYDIIVVMDREYYDIDYDTLEDDVKEEEFNNWRDSMRMRFSKKSGVIFDKSDNQYKTNEYLKSEYGGTVSHYILNNMHVLEKREIESKTFLTPENFRNISPFIEYMNFLTNNNYHVHAWLMKWVKNMMLGIKNYRSVLLSCNNVGQVGKTTFFKIVEALLSPDVVWLTGSSFFDDNFSGELLDKVLVCLDEVSLDDKTDRSKVKNIATSDSWGMNEKYRAKVRIENKIDFIVTTNNYQATDGPFNERFLHLEIKERKEKSFYDALYRCIQNNINEIAAYVLLDVWDEIDTRVKPNTQAAVRLLNLNENIVVNYLNMVFGEGENGGEYNFIRDGRGGVAAAEIKSDFCSRMGENMPLKWAHMAEESGFFSCVPYRSSGGTWRYKITKNPNPPLITQKNDIKVSDEVIEAIKFSESFKNSHHITSLHHYPQFFYEKVKKAEKAVKWVTNEDFANKFVKLIPKKNVEKKIPTVNYEKQNNGVNKQGIMNAINTFGYDIIASLIDGVRYSAEKGSSTSSRCYGAVKFLINAGYDGQVILSNAQKAFVDRPNAIKSVQNAIDRT